MIIGRELIDEYYDERLYSTGNDELDDILERAFCEGYEYAQREYAFRDYEGLDEIAKKELRENRADLAKYLSEKRKRIHTSNWYDKDRLYEDIRKGKYADDPYKADFAKSDLAKFRRVRFDEDLSYSKKRAAEYRDDALRGTKERAAQNTTSKAKGAAQNTTSKAQGTAQNTTSKAQGTAQNTTSKAKDGFFKKNAGRVKRLYTGKSKYGKVGQGVAIGSTALAAAGGIGYGIHRHNKNGNDVN